MFFKMSILISNCLLLVCRSAVEFSLNSHCLPLPRQNLPGSLQWWTENPILVLCRGGVGQLEHSSGISVYWLSFSFFQNSLVKALMRLCPQRLDEKEMQSPQASSMPLYNSSPPHGASVLPPRLSPNDAECQRDRKNSSHSISSLWTQAWVWRAF